MLHQWTVDIFGFCDLCQNRSISMLIYGNIRDLAYFTNSLLFLAAILIFLLKALYQFYFNISEHIHYHDYVETRVSNLKFIKDYDIGPAMT